MNVIKKLTALLLAITLGATSATAQTSSGAGVTFTQQTSGAVLYGSGGNGVSVSDPTRFFWDTINHKLGIGTNSPLYDVDVRGAVASIHPFGEFLALQTTTGTGYRWSLNNDATFRLGYTTDGFVGVDTTRLLFNSSGQAVFSSTPLPSATNTYDLGASSSRWSNVYGVLGNFTGTLTASTITSAASTNLLLNAPTGQTGSLTINSTAVASWNATTLYSGVAGNNFGTASFYWGTAYIQTVQAAGNLSLRAAAATTLVMGVASGGAADVYVNSTLLGPSTTGVLALGDPSLRWLGVYGVLGNFSGALSSKTLSVDDGSTNSTSTVAFAATGASGINIRLTGDGAVTPKKYLRVNGGALQIINDGYSAAILSLSDAGGLTLAGSVTGTTLSASANVRVQDAGYIYTPYNGATDTGTVRAGVQFDGAGQAIGFYTANTFRGSVTSAGVLSMSGAINAAAASGYLLGGNIFVTGDATYNYIRDGAAASTALILGNTGDPQNFYNNTTHLFRNRAGSTTFATLNATGMIVTPSSATPDYAMGLIASALTTGNNVNFRIGKNATTSNQSVVLDYLYDTTTSLFKISHFGDSNSLVIQKGGNVGIGGTPAVPLDVISNTNSSGSAIRQYNASTGGSADILFSQNVGGRYANRTVAYTGNYLIENGNIPTRYSDFDTFFIRNSSATEYARYQPSGSSTPLYKLTVTDTHIGALITGASKGVRFLPTSSFMQMEFVDNTGSGSYQPGIINGSTLALATGGTVRHNVDASGHFYPTAADTYDVGLNANRYRTINANNVSASVAPTTAWSIDNNDASTGNIANGGAVNLAVGSGLIIITSPTTGDTGIYSVGGGLVSFISGSGVGTFVASTTTPAAGKVSIAYSGTNYAVYNNYGSTQAFLVTMIRTRSAN